MLWVYTIIVNVNQDTTIGVQYQVSNPAGSGYSCLAPSTDISDVQNAIIADIQHNLGYTPGTVVFPDFQII
jgi:hypothetical protein